jgi:hypothetical protein
VSPYRTPAQREPELYQFNWDMWLFKPGLTLFMVTTFLVIFLGIHALLALGVQFVVTGFAGLPIGSFWHYKVQVTSGKKES